MKCEKCGKRLPGKHAVCPKCSEGAEPKMVSLGQAGQKRKKPFSPKQLAARIAIIAVAALSAIAVVVVSILFLFIEGNVQQTSELSGDLGINSDITFSEDVQNIALFGLDSRSNNSGGRSDAMIILSIDRAHNKIKMTSLARDTLVPIEGHGKSKLTHAWAFGKASLAVKTINRNFGMNISDYVYVNFFEFADIINHIGGVELDVNSSEMYVMNNTYAKYIESYGIKCPKVTQTGMQRLNGGQALAYARNRYSDSDVARGDRQKEVLEAMFNEVKDLKLSKFPALITKVLGMCHTNLTSSEMLSIATWALTNNPTFERFSLPCSEINPWGGTSAAGYGWVYVYDMNLASAVLHDFIYETETDLSTVSRQHIPAIETSRWKAKTTKAKKTTTTKPKITTTTTTTTTAPPGGGVTEDPNTSTNDPSVPNTPGEGTGTDTPVTPPAGGDQPSGGETSTPEGQTPTP